MKRLLIEITGQVQGVGFRPYVYNLALEHALTGWVQNDALGVSIEVQGSSVTTFCSRLQEGLPPLAEIDTIQKKEISLKNDEISFNINKTITGHVKTKIAPDISICDGCLIELFDPESRYYRYPFINCTNCGPRYTITHHLPYDREATSMDKFKMCRTCCTEYEDPLNRRYHAQPIACKHCGPELTHSIDEIADELRQGKIVAIKFMGGYQLLCDANNVEVVTKLRKKKERTAKPFAVMVQNIESAKKLVDCSLEAENLLNSKERPIVILPKLTSQLASVVAPGLSKLGIMLPYTPIHYLLFNALIGKEDTTSLIVTSANISGAPLIKDDDEAKEKLAPIADMIVSYNREIVTRIDDSVVSLIAKKRVFIRRARSYAPRSIMLPYEVPNTLALGSYLKNTICITRGREAFISQHIGTLNSRENIHYYRETIFHLLKLLNVTPELIACDLHPDSYSTQIAKEFDLPAIPVQHHHAHLAACALEYNITSNAIGIALDGFGLGENQQSWGGELMLYQGENYHRLGSLKPLMQPGGDMAVLQPWRMASSVLFELGRKEEIVTRFSHQAHASSLIQLLENKINSPLTSSLGRLFDAASSLLGVCENSSYEGEAAMRLEGRVTKPIVSSSGWSIRSNQLNLLPLFDELRSCDSHTGANLFHGTLAYALVDWLKQNAMAQQVKHILLSGGCFLNKVMSELMLYNLEQSKLIPLYPRLSPPNDGGISLGQAWVAGNSVLRRNKVCV